MTELIEYSVLAEEANGGYQLDGCLCDNCGRIYDTVDAAMLCESECVGRDNWHGPAGTL